MDASFDAQAKRFERPGGAAASSSSATSSR
jgi:hypothetical protein